MPPQPTFLVQMSGAPGSGKTTTATLLAKEINATIINHDLLKTFFLETSHSFPDSGKLAYRLQWVLAADMLKQKRSVIIDSTCNYADTLDAGIALANECGAEYRYVECRVSVEEIGVLDERLKGREKVRMRSQRSGVERPPVDALAFAPVGEVDYQALFRRWIEGPCRPEVGGIVVFSTLKSPAECVEDIMGQIGKLRDG